MIKFGESFELHGMALAAIIGVILNFVLPGKKEEHIFDTNEEDSVA